MNHAALIDPKREGAMQWAWSHNSQVFWPYLCLQFAVDAYMYGAKWTLHGPYGQNVTAVNWWNAQAGYQHPGDMNPPRGSLVFWSTFDNGAGHAALSLGGGWAISTLFGGNSAVHVYQISKYATNYLGWVPPQ
jgi:hypothetical protein